MFLPFTVWTSHSLFAVAIALLACSWWRDYLRDRAGTGFWHETYFSRGGVEAIYDDMRVPVGLGSHLRSWVPGVHFAVLAGPEPRITEVSDSARLPGPGYPTHLAVSGTGPGTEWLRTRLGADWKCQYLRDLPALPAAPRWWGTTKLVEFAAYIADVGVLYQLVSSAHRERCRWCGLEMVGDRCGFCAAVTAGIGLCSLISTSRARTPSANDTMAAGHQPQIAASRRRPTDDCQRSSPVRP